MPKYLIILVTILVVIAIVLFIYMLWFLRKATIITKKIDYLVEDLTFKSESLKVVFDAAISLSTYFNNLEAVFNDNIDNLINLFNANNDEVKNIIENIKNIMSNAKKAKIIKNKNIAPKRKYEKKD